MWFLYSGNSLEEDGIDPSDGRPQYPLHTAYKSAQGVYTLHQSVRIFDSWNSVVGVECTAEHAPLSQSWFGCCLE